MKKVEEMAKQDRRLKALEAFESEDRTSKKTTANIFELYRPMINGNVVRIRSTVNAK